MIKYGKLFLIGCFLFGFLSPQLSFAGRAKKVPNSCKKTKRLAQSAKRLKSSYEKLMALFKKEFEFIKAQKPVVRVKQDKVLTQYDSVFGFGKSFKKNTLKKYKRKWSLLKQKVMKLKSANISIKTAQNVNYDFSKLTSKKVGTSSNKRSPGKKSISSRVGGMNMKLRNFTFSKEVLQKIFKIYQLKSYKDSWQQAQKATKLIHNSMKKAKNLARRLRKVKRKLRKVSRQLKRVLTHCKKALKKRGIKVRSKKASLSTASNFARCGSSDEEVFLCEDGRCYDYYDVYGEDTYTETTDCLSSDDSTSFEGNFQTTQDSYEEQVAFDEATNEATSALSYVF